MATYSWTGDESDNWSDGGNWSPPVAGGPPAGSDVIIATLGSNSIELTRDTPLLDSVTIEQGDNTLDIGNNVLNVSYGGLTLNSGEVTLEGGTLNDSGFVIVESGAAIVGNGVLNVGGVYAGSGVIEASGGVLDLKGTIGPGIKLEIDKSATHSTLKIDGLTTSVDAIALTGANQTLEVGQTGSLAILRAEEAHRGTIQLDGGTLTDSSGIKLDSPATLIGSGNVDAVVNGPGTVKAEGGTLTFDQGVDLQGGVGQFNIDFGSTLAFDGQVGAAHQQPTVEFKDNAGTLDLTQEARGANDFHGQIRDFQSGDKIEVAGATGDKLAFSNGTLEVENASGHVEYKMDIAGNYSASEFQLTEGNGVDTITTDATCFMAGTLIRTPKGDVPVERLSCGDAVVGTDGRVRAATWVGRQTIATRFADPLRVLPIRIRSGALAENVPSRDLLLSPDHAILVEGTLVHAGALVNGTSILRETAVPKIFVYYHVEVDDHALILAEGAPAETFVDNVDRLNFDNWAEHVALFPEGRTIEELPYPRAKAARQVPVHARVKLAERALALRPARRAVA